MACLLCLFASPAPAASDLNLNNPTQFFTNVAIRLLRSELDVDFARIQIYPTNQYTPAVHRLLQVTANLYDANTNRPGTGYPFLPSVFRPIFNREIIPSVSTNVYITGYQEVIDANNVVTAPLRDLSDPFDLANLDPTNNVHGVPIIIGAKKGFPNFNEYSLQTTVNVRRRLEFRRQLWQSGGDPNDSIGNPLAFTNQLYSVAISNRFAVEAWNSYPTNFPRPLRLIVTNDLTMMFFTSNASTQIIISTSRLGPGSVLNLAAGTWTNFSNSDEAEVMVHSFLIPMQAAIRFATNEFVYVQSTLGFGGFGKTAGIDADPFPINRWWVSLTSHLRYILEDVSAGPTQPRMLDYVTLDIREPNIDVTRELMTGLENPDNPVLDRSEGGQWVTNTLPSSPVQIGILNQILVGLGQLNLFSGWHSHNFLFMEGDDRDKAIARFRYNLGLSGNGAYPDLSRSNIFDCPYVPVRTIYDSRSFQANDPLIHQTLQDLAVKLNDTNTVSAIPPSPDALDNIGKQNTRYQPWYEGDAYNQWNPAFKDPLVYRSDDWNFPNNALSDLTKIGQVHRGTPWQTIYLKSTDVSTNLVGSTPSDWQQWVGNANWADANSYLPQKDRHLASLLVSLLNTNPILSRLSPNSTASNLWLKALDGLSVETNNIDTADILLGEPAHFETLIMQSNSPQARVIFEAINRVRNGSLFQVPGDVLATPELSLLSPWLNLEGDQPRIGISDEMFEKIPAQLLPLLRVDSIGTLTRSSNQVSVCFTGEEGYQYALQTSSDLHHWIYVSINAPTNGVMKFYDTTTSTGTRFYRSVLLP